MRCYLATVADSDVTVPVWLRGGLLLAVTLITGVVIGISYERSRDRPHEAASAQHIIERLTDELALDTTQQKAIEDIFSRRQVAVDSTWHAVQPHVRATLDSTLRDVIHVLRPDQAAKYKRMVVSRHPGALH